MRVELLTTASSIESVRTAWDELASERPFVSHAWLGSWWNCYVVASEGASSVGQSFVLAVFDRDDDLVGLAPWYREHAWPGGHTIRFLGDGLACTEYPTILCRDGQRGQVIAALAQWLNNQPPGCWDAIHLSSCAPDDAMVQQLAQRLQADGHQLRATAGEACWRVALPDNWDEYLSRLSKRNRKRARQMLRTTLESGPATFHTADAADFSARLDQMIQLHRRRWSRRHEADCFDSPRYLRFFDMAANRLAQSGRANLNFLELDGQMIAADFNLVCKGSIYAYQSGVDPDALHHEPGRVLTYETIRRAIEERGDTYDLLRGDEPYKATLRAEPMPTLDVRVIRASRAARLHDLGWSARRQVREWLKKGVLTARRWQATAITELRRAWAALSHRRHIERDN